MALRVLLADESPTIKKVMQISLQDFNIELKAVQLGIDVIQVAEQFQPDIIFCDVLLQKKSGYEVSQEIKANLKTSKIPVVLMWSGFMELDESRFRECKADAHIEKPFDSNALREIVNKLVNKTHDQAISPYLEFPEVTVIAPTPPPPVKPTEPAYVEQHRMAEVAKDSSWTMDSFEEITHFNNKDTELDAFTQKPLQPIPAPTQPQASVKPISTKIAPLSPNFADAVKSERGMGPQGLKLPADTDARVELPPEEDISHSELLANVTMHPEDLDKFNIKPTKKPLKETEPVKPLVAPPAVSVDNNQLQLTQEQLEFIIRSQSKEIIEKIVWKLVPEIADKLIKEEINRLMDENKI